MKKLIYVIVLFSCLNGAAQVLIKETKDFNTFMADANGKAVYEFTNFNYEGNPYFPETYSKATIITTNGTCYIGVKARLNLFTNELMYKTPEGKEMIATSAVSQLIFIDSIENNWANGILFEKGFANTDKNDATTYYRVLDSGKVKLLKQSVIKYSDRKDFGSATVVRVFDETVTYFISKNKLDIQKIEKGKDAILDLLKDKKKEVNTFIEEHNLKCKKETDWQLIVVFYNALFQH